MLILLTSKIILRCVGVDCEIKRSHYALSETSRYICTKSGEEENIYSRNRCTGLVTNVALIHSVSFFIFQFSPKMQPLFRPFMSIKYRLHLSKLTFENNSKSQKYQNVLRNLSNCVFSEMAIFTYKIMAVNQKFVSGLSVTLCENVIYTF